MVRKLDDLIDEFASDFDGNMKSDEVANDRSRKRRDDFCDAFLQWHRSTLLPLLERAGSRIEEKSEFLQTSVGPNPLGLDGTTLRVFRRSDTSNLSGWSMTFLKHFESLKVKVLIDMPGKDTEDFSVDALTEERLDELIAEFLRMISIRR